MSELALRLIEENKITQDPFLDLGNCGLKNELPEELAECFWLKRLNLGDQYYDPKQNKWLKSKNNKNLNIFNGDNLAILQNLTQLQFLVLRNNQIHDISFLQNLTLLQALDLSYNQIQDISFLQNLTQLQSLDLYENQIQDISFLQNLTQLQSLDLHENQIQDISFLQNLTHLQALDLSYNKIQDINFLQNLTILTSLDLSYNKIQDISFLQNLIILKSLVLRNNKIQDISFLQNLTQLQALDLRNNQIQDIVFLQNLALLQTLDLRNNHIQDISFLQNLTQLQSLDIRSNKIQDISFLQNLTLLQSLFLSDNQIQDWKQVEKIIQSQLLNIIYLSDNPLLLPNEIDKDSLANLRAYAEDLKKGITKKRFAKLLFLGDGCVGKTTLFRHLKSGYPPTPINIEARTHGIALDIWEKDLENLKVNVWDFGGQEIFHGTHRLFLGQRALYILVWAKQDNKLCSKEEQHPLKYWLDFIADYGRESTVLLLENTINGDFDDFFFPDEKRLKELVSEFAKRKIKLTTTHYRIDCQNDSEEVRVFKDILKRKLEKVSQDYPVEEYPENWLAVIEELENRRKSTKAISIIEYKKICQDKKISDSHSFLNYLDRIGVVSYFSYLSKDIVILQMEWVLDALYEAFRQTDNKLVNTEGKLNDDDFDKIWTKYNDEEKGIFKSYMLRSELLAQIPHRTTCGELLLRPYKYLIPNLFPNAYKHQKQKWDDKLQYWLIKFQFIYPALMHRLQVKILNICHNNEEENFYKNYLSFTGKQNQECFIEVLEESKEMRIWTDTSDFYVELINLINEIYPLERVNVFKRVKEQEDREIVFFMNEKKGKYEIREND